MAKVLLVDTNFSSAPIYQAMLLAGHEVHVVGGNPQDCLAKSVPNYWRHDYSDTAALATLIDDQKFEFIVPGCTDRSYAACVAAGRGRFPGIDTPEATEAINHKAKFREIAARLGLPVPRVFRDSGSIAGCPVIVKPVDAFSGKGITVIHEPNPAAIERAMANARSASCSGDCIIEEYVQGQLYSHSAFLQAKRVVQDFLVQEDASANPFAVDTSRVLDGSNDRLLQHLRRCIETLAQELDLADGLVHTQFIANDNGMSLIEATRRCPGDLYSQLIELSTGFPYAHAYAQPFLGSSVAAATVGPPRSIMRHTITTPTERNLGYVAFQRPVQIERWVPLSLVGDKLKASPGSRIAVIFCREPTGQALEDLYQCTLYRKLYAVQ